MRRAREGRLRCPFRIESAVRPCQQRRAWLPVHAAGGVGVRRSAARLEWPAFTSPCCGPCFEGCEAEEERVLWVGRRACFPPRVRAVVAVTFDGPIITASSRDGTHALRGDAILNVATSTPCDARRPSLSLRLSRDV